MLPVHFAHIYQGWGKDEDPKQLASRLGVIPQNKFTQFYLEKLGKASQVTFYPTGFTQWVNRTMPTLTDINV